MGGCVRKAEDVFPKNPPKNHGDIVATISDLIVTKEVVPSGPSLFLEETKSTRSIPRRRTGSVVAVSDGRPQAPTQPRGSCIVRVVPLSEIQSNLPSAPETCTSHSSSPPSSSSDSVDSSISVLSPTLSGKVIPLRLVEKLGSGIDAKVYSARRLDRVDHTGAVKVLFQESNDVALKITRKGAKKKDSFDRVTEEAKVLQILRHPNIVRLYQVIDTENSIILVLEKAIGDLVPYVQKNGPIKESIAKRWAFQLITAMDYAHTVGYVHGDLKPDNILLRADHSVCVTDWAFARSIYDPGLRYDYNGSENYSPPEYFTRAWGKSREADVWSLGATIYSLLTAKLPFGVVTQSTNQHKVIHGYIQFPPDEEVHLSDECKSFIRSMMLKNRQERSIMRNYLAMEWLSSEKSLYDDFTALRMHLVE